MKNCAGLLHGADDIAAAKLIADLCNGSELPLLFTVKCRNINASADGGADTLSDLGQGPLDAVIDVLQHTRSELNGHGHARAFDDCARADAGGLLVNLDGGLVAGHIQDFSDKSLGADTDDIGYIGISQTLCDHKRAGNFSYSSAHYFLSLIIFKDIRAYRTLDRSIKSRQTQAEAALSARDKDYRRHGAVLIFVYLRAELGGEIFLDVDYRNIFPFTGQTAQHALCLGGIRNGICLKAERRKAHDGLTTADDRNFKHIDHAAFPV